MRKMTIVLPEMIKVKDSTNFSFEMKNLVKTLMMKTQNIVFKNLLLGFSVLFICSCERITPTIPYSIPAIINDGLTVSTLDDVGMDSDKIMKAVGKVKNGKYNEVHSMLIYKDSKLVLEEYFTGHEYKWDEPSYYGKLVNWNINSMHSMMSCSKSFTSACIGIAIDKGFIDNVNQSIFDYLPDHQQYKKDGKEYITIEHVLTMTLGFEWNEWTTHVTSPNDIDRIYFECSDDPLKCILERNLIAVPGEFFTYNGGGTVILGEIIRNATQMNIDEFSMKYLFGPLGIDSTYWFEHKNGVIATDGSLKLTSRDMIKFGALYLNNGMWKGERLLSENWVNKSKETYNNNKDIKVPIEDSGKSGYGYTWWTNELSMNGETVKMYRANGWGGQSIMVFPELDMVVVFTGGNYDEKSKLFEIIEKYVLETI
jgi:CubicO group peptidase (beta-lactamase class C family)